MRKRLLAVALALGTAATLVGPCDAPPDGETWAGWGNSTRQNDQSDIDKYRDYTVLLEQQDGIGKKPIK
jgi:hypothetical protein